MEQLINTMLANTQIPQIPQTGKKSEPAGQKDGFQKLLEQKADASQTPEQEKPEAPQKPQDAQDAQTVRQAGEGQARDGAENGRELEERMALAAMAMLQTTVVPVEQAMTPEAQAEAVQEEAAPLAVETVMAPEVRGAAPKTEERTLEAPPEEGGTQAVDQTLKEELPQTIRAPEAAEKPEERTVEVKVESGEAAPERPETAEAGEAEKTVEPQGGEAEAPVFEDVKAVPVKVGEAPKAAEQPVEKQIAPKISEALANGETRVEIQLTPENLGKVTVEMTWSRDGSLVVQMHAENRGTQDLLARNTHELAQMLGREAQQEVRVEVPRQEESQRQDLYEQQQEHHQRRQQEQRRKQETGGEDFLQQLRLGLIPLDGE